MEEKERYIIDKSTNYYTNTIVDTKTNAYYGNIEEHIDLLNKQNKENQQLKEAQKQLAIEELKLALDNFRNRPAYFDVARQELCLSEQDKQFIDFINNRIKELGGGR